MYVFNVNTLVSSRIIHAILYYLFQNLKSSFIYPCTVQLVEVEMGIRK